MNYRKLNNLTGWVVGIIATIVYLMTMEATASYWDCGEFLSVAYKQEVGHSPGAPLFMMIQRMFGLLASSKGQVAYMINAWSAIASGLTILFLVWTITHLAKKLVAPGDVEPDTRQRILIMGAGIVGGLAYTFSDTFWFSAVEAEVYATSSLFTALTFWAMLKWENVADSRYSDRWLVLIAYLIGLSVGVHLLNLLTIPTLAMIYYFRRYKSTIQGAFIAFLVGVAALALVQFGIIQYITILAAKFDVLFVNSFHLPFDSGALFSIVLIIAIMIAGLMWARKRGHYLLHTGLLCIIFIMVGFSSYLVPMIRSRADVPIDMTNPDNTISLVSYVQREQFGQQPLLYGQDFDARAESVDSTGSKYAKSKNEQGKDYYEVVGKKQEYKFEAEHSRFFPRIWDNNDPSHIQFYRQFLGLSGDESPTSGDNMAYFMRYQMNWMWWRYFMWNYAGRQNDFEGQGGARSGNWISGIGFIDKLMGRGDISKMGDGYRNNGARNELYFLPLILGILGMVYQYKRNRKDFTVVAMLFFFTGIAIGIYLNMTPLQPRERDYAFAGCTYAFAIWIGLGLLMVYQWFNKAIKGSGAAYAAISICLLAVPVLMASQEWDDHNRSHKTLARATAFNSLQSCAKNAVLFTYGDNETYPLWYLQEIEGIRPDVRVINTSLLGIDWYIDQLSYRINDADAVPMIWKRGDFLGDRHNYVSYVTKEQAPSAVDVPKGQFIPLADVMKFMVDPKNTLPTQSGEAVNYIPTKNFFVPSPNRAALLSSGLLAARDTTRASADMRFSIKANNLYKGQLAQLNIIAGTAAEGWKRPVYFSNLQEIDEFGDLGEYMRLEGTVYRLMPYKVARDTTREQGAQDLGSVDAEKGYNLFMNTYIWGNADRNDVYFDEPNRRNFYVYRMSAPRVSDALVAQGRQADAVKLLDRVMQGISEHSNPYDFTIMYMGMGYYHAGAKAQAAKITRKLAENVHANVRWAMTLRDNDREGELSDAQRELQTVFQLYIEAVRAGDGATADWVLQQVQAMIGETTSFESLQNYLKSVYGQLAQMRGMQVTPAAGQ